MRYDSGRMRGATITAVKYLLFFFNLVFAVSQWNFVKIDPASSEKELMWVRSGQWRKRILSIPARLGGDESVILKIRIDNVMSRQFHKNYNTYPKILCAH